MKLIPCFHQDIYGPGFLQIREVLTDWRSSSSLRVEYDGRISIDRINQTLFFPYKQATDLIRHDIRLYDVPRELMIWAYVFEAVSAPHPREVQRLTSDAGYVSGSLIHNKGYEKFVGFILRRDQLAIPIVMVGSKS